MRRVGQGSPSATRLTGADASATGSKLAEAEYSTALSTGKCLLALIARAREMLEQPGNTVDLAAKLLGVNHATPYKSVIGEAAPESGAGPAS